MMNERQLLFIHHSSFIIHHFPSVSSVLKTAARKTQPRNAPKEAYELTKQISCLCGALAALLLLTTAAGNVRAQEQAVLRWGADPSGGAPYVYADPSRPD